MAVEAYNSFGAWVRQQRKVRDLTQDALAELVGCSSEMIRKIEAGKARPSRQMAELIVARFDAPQTQQPDLVRWARGGPAPDPASASSVESATTAVQTGPGGASLIGTPGGLMGASLPRRSSDGPRTNLPFA